MSSALVLEPGRNGLPRFIYNHHSLMSLMSYTAPIHCPPLPHFRRAHTRVRTRGAGLEKKQ